MSGNKLDTFWVPGASQPDKLAARGSPKSMRPVAEERSRKLNKAYDLIKDSRGMV